MNKAEERIQQEIYVWFWNNYCLPKNKIRELIYHVPNENNPQLFKIGLYPGCADLIHTWKGKHYYCEVKTETGTLSPAQKNFQKHVQQSGYIYYIATSLEEFQDVIHRINIDFEAFQSELISKLNKTK